MNVISFWLLKMRRVGPLQAIHIFLTLLFLLLIPVRIYGAEQAPVFLLKDLQGNSYSLKEMIGKGIIHLTFLASWCEPCRKDYPKLNASHEKLRTKGYILLGIGVPARQNEDKLKRLAKRENIQFPILFDSSGGVSKAYDVSLPQNIIIDRKGSIILRWDSLPPDFTKTLEAYLSRRIGTAKF